MSKNKSYTYNGVSYRFAGKWHFNAINAQGKTTTVIMPLKGGKVVADAVARQIAGAMKRKGEMDNLARAAIQGITAKAA